MATLILYNGPIYTLDPAQPRAQAIALRDGRVLAVGSEGRVQAAAGGRAELIDLRGRAAIPALTDAHVHLTWHALGRREVRLEQVADFDVALARVAAAAAGLPPGAWLRGGGWDHTAWGGRWPSADDLDALVHDRPVCLTRKDGHSVWVNRRALELAGIDERTADPPGGSIRRERGRPTGLLFENAVELVRRHIPPPDAAFRQAALRDALAEAHSYGMAGVHIPALGGGLGAGDAGQTLGDVQQLRERGELTLRCLVHIGVDQLEEALALGLRSGLGDRWVRVGAIKLFADGSLGSETAELLRPYEGRSHRGIATLDDAALHAAVRRAAAGGFAVAVHAIGDAANRRVLDAIAAAIDSAERQPAAARRAFAAPHIPNRIEHAQLLDPRDLPRFAELGVVASVQPVHATADMAMADALWGARCAHAYAWRALRDAGATLAFGSDAPVESLNPWLGIHAAVTRCRRDGSPEGGWYPAQRLSVAEALHGFTVGAALAAGAAHELGTLAPGMLADLAVLSADPFKVAPAELHAIGADLTIVEGEVVWERSGQG